MRLKKKPKILKYSEILFFKYYIQTDIFNILVFAARNSTSAQFPEYFKIISPFSFSVYRLISVELHEQVTRIEKAAFFDCVFLKYVFILQNSQLQVIGKMAFEHSTIGCFYIPPKVSCFFVNAFSDCNQLVIVEIDENSHLEEINYPHISEFESYIIMVPMKLRNLFKNNGN
ncbi:hypothetical protein M9Y10_032076 [Tritrichomonas musculus]|uniref:Uncharacterized protein n=1 Tax=Tritrichomonas musculus TaxID=1915356 RepID=A0ABR2GJ28_9EUKA